MEIWGVVAVDRSDFTRPLQAMAAQDPEPLFRWLCGLHEAQFGFASWPAAAASAAAAAASASSATADANIAAQPPPTWAWPRPAGAAGMEQGAAFGGVHCGAAALVCGQVGGWPVLAVLYG